MNLIFDLDGTLLYTLEDLTDAVNYSLKQFDFPLRSIEEIQSAVGNGLRKLIERSVPKGTKITDQVLQIMKAYYAEHCCDKTTPYAHIEEQLSKLREDGHKICIVSNKADQMVQIMKKRYFPAVDLAIGESDTNAKKPAPDMVHYAIERFGEDAVYIGDSEVDIQTAKNANIPCICVSWGYRSEDALLAAGAERICHSPDALYEMIQDL